MVKDEAADVERVFIGGGCNRIVNNVSWGACGLISFASQNAVSIFSPQTAKILTTLPGHKALVNCTHWLPSSKFACKATDWEKHYLLSGDAEGVIILWEFSLAENKWRNVSQLLESHKEGVTCITSIITSQTEAIFASTSSDCVVNIWKIVLPSFGGDCTITCLDSLSTGIIPMVTLSLAELPANPTHLILAMGGLDNKQVHLYSGDSKGKFVSACELKGHTDWIRSLDFSLPVETNSLLLVSASQDTVIRIWKMSICENSFPNYMKGPVFVSGPFSYQVSIESLLFGHGDWVYSVEWKPPSLLCDQPQSILSASMDKTMMIWQPERTTGIWLNIVTVSELSDSALGFYGGHWSPNADSILAHDYGGSFHLWKNVGDEIDNWKRQKVPSGHFAAVTDIAWGRDGEYLMSVSHDQTTRIFAPNEAKTWHEIARPQVHGHVINCLTIIKGKGNYNFVSGADENFARVFEAQASSDRTDGTGNEGFDTMEQLAWHTLWPKSGKLYGNVNQIFSLCCDHQGKFVASSCKAQSASVVEIWLWEVGTWNAVSQLQAHSLTVTQMEFSYDGKYLLAVSTWLQKSLGGTDESKYKLQIRQKAHKRIVWACSWNPSSHQFATGSRDKTVKIWKVHNGCSVQQLITLRTFKSSVTALSWTAPNHLHNRGILAVGMESGLIELWNLSFTENEQDPSLPIPNESLVIKFDPFMCHVSSVNRLAWRESEKKDDYESMQLASCGADHCVRIFKVTLV